MGELTDRRISRVGFRDGTDRDLRALHAVEAPIAAERGSNRMPQPLESYVAYALEPSVPVRRPRLAGGDV